jgi:hypothetical protein
MKAICIATFVALLFAACSKGSLEDVPQVKIESFGPREVVKGQLFRMVASITDKQGDIRDSSLRIVRKLYRGTIVTTDTIRQPMNVFANPSLRRFEVMVTFNYGEQEDNTIFQNYDGVERNISLGLIVVDDAGNRSPYVESERILLKRL